MSLEHSPHFALQRSRQTADLVPYYWQNNCRVHRPCFPAADSHSGSVDLVTLLQTIVNLASSLHFAHRWTRSHCCSGKDTVGPAPAPGSCYTVVSTSEAACPALRWL